MNTSEIDLKTIMLAGFETLKNNFCNYIESNIKRTYFMNNQWISILYKDKNINVNFLNDPDLFRQTTDVQFLLTLYAEQWESLFKYQVSSTYTLNLCQLISFQLEQLLVNYKFNTREVYRCIELINTFLEELGQNTNDIETLRAKTFAVLYANPI